MRLAELAEIRMGYPFRSRLEHEPDGNVAVIQMKDIDDTDLLHAQDAIRVSLPDVKARHPHCGKGIWFFAPAGAAIPWHWLSRRL